MRTVIAICIFLFLLITACAAVQKSSLTDEQTPVPAHSFKLHRDVEYTDLLTGMKFVFVEGGCYQMGDVFGDGDSTNETPVHEVCVDDLYIGKYEVTQDQWKAVMDTNPSFFNECGGDCPVENTTWYETQEFLARLSKKTGKVFRLPTEAEWEYAARSRGKSQKWSGTNEKTALDEYAWFSNNGKGHPHPVGRKKPNELGLYDMSGNVWEWVFDWYGEKYYAMSPRQNPKGPDSGLFKVLRSGSWDFYPLLIRTMFRLKGKPNSHNSYFGFRCVLVPE